MTSTTAREAETSPPLQAHCLYRFFRAGDEEILALRGVSLVVDAGEFVVVRGPSGSGKSTLLACLTGIDEPDGGHVTVMGARMSHRPEPERTRIRRLDIGLLFQHGNLIDHLTLAQNITLVGRLNRTEAVQSTDELLADLELSGRAGAYPSELSGGETARAGIAVALINDPAILIADEPTGELDLATERTVLALLKARARRGTAVLIASHSPAVCSAADRIVTLADGQLVP